MKRTHPVLYAFYRGLEADVRFSLMTGDGGPAAVDTPPLFLTLSAD